MRASPPAPPTSPGGVEQLEQLDKGLPRNEGFAKPSAASRQRHAATREKKDADHEASLERERAAATFATNRASERRPSRGGAAKPTPRYAAPNAAAKSRLESTKAKSSLLDSILQRAEQKAASDEWSKRREATPGPHAAKPKGEEEATPAYALPTAATRATTAATTAKRKAAESSGGALAGRLGGVGGTTTAQEMKDESDAWKRNRAAAVAAAAATAAGRKTPPAPMYTLPTRAAAARAATESVAPSAVGSGTRGGAAARLREEEAKQQAEIFRRRAARKRAAKKTGDRASTAVPRYAQPTQATGARRASASGPGRPVAVGESTRGGAHEKGKRAERDAERLAWRGRGSTKSPPTSARFASSTKSSLQRSRYYTAHCPPPTDHSPPSTGPPPPPPPPPPPCTITPQSRAATGRRDRTDAPRDRLRQRSDHDQQARVGGRRWPRR